MLAMASRIVVSTNTLGRIVDADSRKRLSFSIIKLMLHSPLQIGNEQKYEYGNVITIWLGPLPTVHILDLETAKEEMLTNGAAYVDRYAPYMIDREEVLYFQVENFGLITVDSLYGR
ncbi:hypothetical protein TELCIR_08349 [Teladorsagia circumcincta]|uniref:Uncharacterized protein n=1 Tax=Teladorsagia circumcincta TaxID=45464 RepID=A0A2G9UI46_TELCI|nr:hypothetical protein TELCIR_08349 [Teladorsagia circumcincta]